MRRRPGAWLQRRVRGSQSHGPCLHLEKRNSEKVKAVAPAAATKRLPLPQLAGFTLVELRQKARDRNIAGYSRFNKADLIAALEPSQSA